MSRFTRDQLRRELEQIAHVPVELTLTTNASSYISFVPGQVPLQVRMQRLFLDAPDEVLVGVGRWMGGRAKGCPKVVHRFINSPPPELLKIARTRQRRLKTRGRCYDLALLLDQVNREYFGGQLSVRITWGRQSVRKKVQARTLGAYYRVENIVFINPVLDQWEVPEWFVAFTVYHECLHAMQPAGQQPHGREFRQALRRHHYYSAALRWEKANIRLLTRRNDISDQRRAAWRVEPPPPAKGQLGFGW